MSKDKSSKQFRFLEVIAHGMKSKKSDKDDKKKKFSKAK